jgi:hypothetical protein
VSSSLNFKISIWSTYSFSVRPQSQAMCVRRHWLWMVRWQVVDMVVVDFLHYLTIWMKWGQLRGLDWRQDWTWQPQSQDWRDKRPAMYRCFWLFLFTLPELPGRFFFRILFNHALSCYDIVGGGWMNENGAGIYLLINGSLWAMRQGLGSSNRRDETPLCSWIETNCVTANTPLMTQDAIVRPPRYLRTPAVLARYVWGKKALSTGPIQILSTNTCIRP